LLKAEGPETATYLPRSKVYMKEYYANTDERRQCVECEYDKILLRYC